MSESLKVAQDETAALDDKGSSAAPLSMALEDLRAALLALKPAGPGGFEGLLATVLGKISGQDFRLAKSGLQNGKDGATFASEDNYISFEGKLYNTKINDNEILTKITRLIGSGAPPDLWVLGATVEVSTQLLDPMQVAAARNGIGTLVLDWPSSSTVPPLAAACAIANEETCAFLRHNVNDAAAKKAEAALAKIRQAKAFRPSADSLVRAIQEPSLGLANAKTANARWLESALADRSRAKATFGQVLAPNAAGPLPLRQRPALVQQVHQHLMTAPSRKIVALVGGEGRGKSWLLAQSWLELADRPLLAVIPATDLKPVAAYGSLTPFLISKLIQQTDESDEEISRKRWERRIMQWKEQAQEASPRFILCVDGLNQQPGFDWPRWLDAAAAVVEQLGGALIITARESYFNERIRSAVHAKIATVRVPEWTETDLREILSAKGIDARKIKPAVLTRLRNPRILGIAFELLDKVEVLDFNELSVERLLFEHIRAGVRDGNAAEPPDQFSKRLAQHAQAILERVKHQQREDQLIFDRADGQGGHTLSADLLAVTAEHFFQPLPEDHTLYTLADDGLSLALGLSIIKALQKAERNERDVADALDELIEPIAALDRTADAVFSGVMASSIDEQCSLAIRRALICGFLRLQNIDAQNYPAFVAIARNATDAAMWALFDLSTTTSRYAANKDWLSAALRECRHKPECCSVITAHVSDWLRSYSLDPKIGLMSTSGHDNADNIAKDIAKRTQVLAQKMARLSAAERQFLENNMLERKDYDPSRLWEDAFEMLAGMPLAGFAEQLVACSFSLALNSSLRAPYDEYLALIRFNRRDWEETRRRLLEASDFLAQNDTSHTGQWALVAILRGTSTVEDAKREEQLVEELTKDREKFGSWRLVEKYCTADPCDPASTKPDNIDATAKRYGEVNVDEISRQRFMGADDHFVRDALPGLARFAPELAIESWRKIARSIVAREAPELMLGVTSLERHCAMLDSEAVCKLIEIANTLSSPRDLESKDSRDNWIAAQYAIQIAFPHLDGNAQLDILVGLPSHGPPLLKLSEVFKSATPEKLEHALDKAIQSGEHSRALSALLFARRSSTNLTPRSRTLIGQFAEHERSAVRAEAMDIIAHLKDADLIEGVVTTGWNAILLDPRENHFEIWYGSLVIIQAAKQGMISPDDALERITPRLYSVAAEVLGAGCHAAVAARLTAAARKALSTELPFAPPAVEQDMGTADRAIPPLLSLAEPDEILGPKAFFRRMSETPEDFEARQRQGWEAFNRFEAALTKEKARLIVEDTGFDGVDACVSTSPDHCASFVRELLGLDERKLVHVQNFALMLARAVSRYDLTLARELFDRLSGRRAYVSLVFGLSKVPLEAICVWESADGGALDDLRMLRLDRAANDHQLAQEVLAALMAGKTEFLEQYTRKNLESLEPASNARALMVVGFGAESPVSDALINEYRGVNGLIGRAAKSARFAYDRNSWARHWFEKMCATDSAEEFWAFSALFLKITDARFGLWGGDVSRAGSAMPKFAASIRNRVENRAKAWKAKREKTLCGDKVPGEVYMVLD